MVIHIAQAAQIKVVFVQVRHPCRIAAAIRVIYLDHAAIRDAVEVVVVAVDKPNIGRNGFRFPDAPPADAGRWNVLKHS